MTYDELALLCGSLPGTSHVRQWGGAHVWKVGGKVFAIGGWNGAEAGITFKADAAAYAMLKDQPGLRPAPYFAARGMAWIQQYGPPGLGDEDLAAYIRRSYEIVAAGLPRRKRSGPGPG